MTIGDYVFVDEQSARIVSVHKKSSDSDTATIIAKAEALEAAGGISANDEVEVTLLCARGKNKLVSPDKLLPPAILEVVWPENMKADDIEVITPATREQPGLARLKQAVLGVPNVATAHSIPVLSPRIGGGEKIGFVTCEVRLTQPPYDYTYRLS